MANSLSALLPVLLGLFEGILWGGFKYALAKYKSQPEPFDATLFFKTLLIGIIINAVATVAGTPIDEPQMIAILQLVTIFVDAIVNAIIRKMQVIQSNVPAKTG